MVEMVETAHILRGATGRSLVILDEVGRGTSTHDGRAVAQAVLEYIHDDPRLRCRTLFATHYHELADLAEQWPAFSRFDWKCWNKAPRSSSFIAWYPVGLTAATACMCPRPAFRTGGQPCAGDSGRAGGRLRPPTASPASRAPLTENRAMRRLRTLEPMQLTPLQALEELIVLQTMANEDAAEAL